MSTPSPTSAETYSARSPFSAAATRTKDWTAYPKGPQRVETAGTGDGFHFSPLNGGQFLFHSEKGNKSLCITTGMKFSSQCNIVRLRSWGRGIAARFSAMSQPQEAPRQIEMQRNQVEMKLGNGKFMKVIHSQDIFSFSSYKKNNKKKHAYYSYIDSP